MKFRIMCGETGAMRGIMISRIAPVSPHMILNFIAEKVLGLPRSY